MSIFVVRAFKRMREALAANQQIIAKLTELEGRIQGHDTSIKTIVDAIRQLMEPAPRNGRRIGFETPFRPAKVHGKARRLTIAS